MANKNYYRFTTDVQGSTETITLDASTTYNHCTLVMEQCKIDPIKSTLQTTKVQYGAAYHSFTEGTRKIKFTIAYSGAKNYVEALTKTINHVISPGKKIEFGIYAGNWYTIDCYLVSSIEYLTQNPTFYRLSFQVECPFPYFKGKTWSGTTTSRNGVRVVSDSHKESEINLEMRSSEEFDSLGGMLGCDRGHGDITTLVYTFPEAIHMYHPTLFYDSEDQTFKVSYSQTSGGDVTYLDLLPYISLASFDKLPRPIPGEQNFKWIPEGEPGLVNQEQLYSYAFEYAEVPKYWF